MPFINSNKGEDFSLLRQISEPFSGQTQHEPFPKKFRDDKQIKLWILIDVTKHLN